MRLPPETFWSMTLTEWRAAVKGFTRQRTRGTAPLARARLDALMRKYPD